MNERERSVTSAIGGNEQIVDQKVGDSIAQYEPFCSRPRTRLAFLVRRALRP